MLGTSGDGGREEEGKMEAPVDLHRLTPSEDIIGGDSDETASLKMMLDRAVTYLKSFRWCPPISQKYLGFGVGDVVALFLFRLETPISGSDEWLWVVVGDLPSAYFVVDKAHDPASALHTYCHLMDEWVHAVLNNTSLNDVFPVQAEATTKNARMLLSRTKYIRESIIPQIP
jgi:hypothetical protein